MNDATNGKISDSVRRSQALPLSWDVPRDAEIDRLRARLWKMTDRRSSPPKPASIEGAILLVLCMQTGEDIKSLHGAFRSSNSSSLSPPLLMTSADEKFSIIMRPTTDARPIHLPQTKLLTRLLAMQPPLSEPFDLLFNFPLSVIKKEASELIRGDENWRSRSPKAARSLLAHNRWLFRRIREESKGDPALVALLQPNRPAAEQTLRSYCAITQNKLVKHYRRAIKPLGGISPMHQNHERDELLVGRAKLPDNDQLRHDIRRIGRLLVRPMIAPSVATADKLLWTLPVTRDWHIAMMAYTYILATFGTGQRGRQAPSNECAIERESGFSWVVEKGNPKLGLAGARGVFHCRTVRDQLARYEDYLDTIQRMLKRRDPCLASDLQTLRKNNDRLVFFDIRNGKAGKPGKLLKLTPNALCKVARNIGWKYEAATGRRWLRSQLTAALPSDALAAQFGHNLDGLDVWSQHSGLQVKELPSILGPQIECTLSRIGLEPLSSKPPKRRAKISTGRDMQISHQSDRDRSGQLLASMIWHGALLQADQHEAALQALVELDPSKEPLPWILLDAPHNQTRRWVLDPITLGLAKRYRDAGLQMYPAIETVIKEYFKSRENFVAFIAAATTRWRFKLPPILFAKAIGDLNDHDLPNSQIQNRQNEYKDRRPEQSFTQTAQDMIAWLEQKKKNNNKSKRGHKYALYRQLHEEVTQQAFWQDMPQLERWLALASIQLLVADRGKENPTGYAFSTTIDKVKRVFGYFANDDVGRYKNLALNEWPPEKITQFLPIGRVRQDVVADLASLVKAYAFQDDETDILESLIAPENHTSFIVTPSYYGQLLNRKVGPSNAVALALCYRTGIRINELKHLTKDMFELELDQNQITLRLDHKPNWKLKTFHSRRIIPLDVLMESSEKEDLRKLLEKTTHWVFPLAKETEDKLEEVFEAAPLKGDVTTMALRHSFATNAYASILWPNTHLPNHAHFFDPDALSRRQVLRMRLCGKSSLGAIGPHAIATVMGHTSPSRTLFNYAHNLEFVLAAHVATWQKVT